MAYFGFYREGCVCPIGSIQNVTVALIDPKLLAFPSWRLRRSSCRCSWRCFSGALFAAVCAPLGAIQELVVLKPAAGARRLDQALGWLKYVYLGTGHPVRREARGAPRFHHLPLRSRSSASSASPARLTCSRLGGAFLIGGMFVGRPYCRYLCPYGGLLSWCSRLADRGVTITPDKELDCGLCTDACPYGAIEQMRAVGESASTARAATRHARGKGTRAGQDASWSRGGRRPMRTADPARGRGWRSLSLLLPC